MTQNYNNSQKCYNSFSCILSVLIIFFVVGSITWNMLVTTPSMRKSIEEIRIEVKDIHGKIDSQYKQDTLRTFVLEPMEIKNEE